MYAASQRLRARTPKGEEVGTSSGVNQTPDSADRPDPADRPAGDTTTIAMIISP